MPSAKEDEPHEMEGQLSPQQNGRSAQPGKQQQECILLITNRNSSRIRESPSGSASPAESAQGDHVILEGTAQGHRPEEL
eukprot:212647-Heterocapsa_arctica.AAC.1